MKDIIHSSVTEKHAQECRRANTHTLTHTQVRKNATPHPSKIHMHEKYVFVHVNTHARALRHRKTDKSEAHDLE